MIDKRVLEDTRISYKAKGLLAYLLSRPPDWKVMMEDLINRSTDGREAVQSALKELEACGYAQLVACAGGQGNTFAGKRWIVAESPELLESPDKRVSPSSGFPTVGKSATTNNDLTKNEVTNSEGLLFDLGEEQGIQVEKSTTQQPREKGGQFTASGKILETQAEKIYAEYPRKQDKTAAIKAIVTILKKAEFGENTFTYLLSKVKRYAILRMSKEMQFTKKPENFFKDGTYLDDEEAWAELHLGKKPQNGTGASYQQQQQPKHKIMSAQERRNAANV